MILMFSLHRIEGEGDFIPFLIQIAPKDIDLYPIGAILLKSEETIKYILFQNNNHMLYELYIAGQLCDLDDDISIALSYTSIDTDQPTAEHGSYSKSVELKGTEKNNAIFGQLFIPSRNILGDDPSAGGVYFDPRKRTDYVLWYNGDIIDRGYLKVDNVNNINGDITYSITLYSDLGDFFYNLMYNQSTGEEITLGDLYYGFKDISGNTIDENDGTLLYWDKDFVEESWNALSAGTTDMRVQNHIVAAPTYGGYYDDFDNNKVLVNYGSLGDGSAKQLLQPVFNSDPATRSGYTDYRGWILTEATRDLDEWEVRDLRSVYQRPAIKLSTILDAISNPENNGGYEVNWDEDIKNSPYYRKSYLLLNRLNFDLDANANSISGLGTQLPVVTCSNGVFQDGKLWDAANSASTIFNLSGYTYPHVTISMENYFTNMSAFDQVTSGKTLYTSYWCQYHAGQDLDHYRAWVYGGMAVRVSAYSGDTMKAQTPVYLYTTPVYNSNKPFGYGVDNWKWLMANQLQVEEGDIVVRENNIIWDNERGQNKWAMPIEIDLNLPSEDNLTLYLQIAWVWVASRSDAGVGIAFQTSSADKGYMSRPYWNAIVVLLNDDENSTGIYDGTINPNVQKTNVTKQILFGESESPYTYLVGFTRMMGAKFKYDLAAKKIYILSRNHYYLPEVEIIDEYIDRSQDYEITPTLSEYKWYEYGFETPETYAAQLYNRKNKIEYGKKKVDTGYYFNNDSNNLFEDIPYTNGIPYLQQSIYYSIVENVPSILVSPTLDVSIFKQSGDTVEDESIRIKGYSSYYTVNILPDASGNKICCFDADNEPVEDLTDCLVFFDGMREMLDDYQISDNIPIMNTLNEKPCFMYVSGQTPVYAEKDAVAAAQVCKKVRNIPVFSKYLTNAEGVYTNSLDFSKPAYTFIGNGEKYGDDIAIYDKYWKAFISDLYERNAKAVTCWVFLREKPEQAMRKFYYFDNSIWAIAEVTDYDASSDDPTQVKFVKVYDISNYTDGEVDWGYDDDEKPRPVPPVPSGETSYTFQWEYPQYEEAPKVLVFFPSSGGTVIYQTFESSREYGEQKTYHIPYTISNNTGGIVNVIESGQTGNMEYVNFSVLANPTADDKYGSINFTQSDSGEIMRLDLYQHAGSGSTGVCSGTSVIIYTSGDTSGVCSGTSIIYRNVNGDTREKYFDGGYIQPGWFSGRTDIASVDFCYGMTDIGVGAFSGCTNLTAVTLPDSIERIGFRPVSTSKREADGAFADCGLTSVVLPNSLVRINPYTFYDCESLTSVTIPSSVVGIHEGAFAHCDSLFEVTIPESVTGICVDNPTILYHGAFQDCHSLGVVDFEGNSKLTKIDKSTFYGCESLYSIDIPNSVTTIGSSAFEGCRMLPSITIPSGVTSISSYAFGHCTSLTAVTILSGVTSIGASAFELCTSLTAITIPNSVTSIGSAAFSGCTNLTSITLPSSATSIGSSVFRNCTSLTSVTIPSGVTRIYPETFYNCYSLTSVTIPSGITVIDESAFRYCRILPSVTIPSGVILIDESAFRDCYGLTSVTIPSSVTTIRNSAFRDCSSLTSITCYAYTAPSLSDYVFDGIASGGTLYVPTGSDYSSYSSWLSAISSGWTITYI